MKGIVFHLLQEVYSSEFGEDAWDDLLDAAGMDGAFTSLGSYDDAQLFKLVGLASEKHGMTNGQVVHWLGEKSMPLLAAKYPALFAQHTTARTFILSLNTIIHPEVRKLYPGADVPEFEYLDASPGRLVMGYRSLRRMCWFATGLMHGAARHYNESIIIDEIKCMHRGDEYCLFDITIKPLVAEA